MDQEIRAKESELATLDSTLKEKHGERFRLDLELGNLERLKRELAEEALAELRRQGVPYMVCLTCPGYISVKSFVDIAKSVVGSRPPSSGAGKPAAPASQPQGSPASGPGQPPRGPRARTPRQGELAARTQPVAPATNRPCREKRARGRSDAANASQGHRRPPKGLFCVWAEAGKSALLKANAADMVALAIEKGIALSFSRRSCSRSTP
ncbi:MAG: hypothetical protein Q8P22_11845 [Chloroflexota bacterium]|nr:hypothetical protein [Chloroflexota bacterium]